MDKRKKWSDVAKLQRYRQMGLCESTCFGKSILCKGVVTGRRIGENIEMILKECGLIKIDEFTIPDDKVEITYTFSTGYTFKKIIKLEGEELTNFRVYHLKKFLDKIGELEDIEMEAEEWLEDSSLSATIKLDSPLTVKKVYCMGKFNSLFKERFGTMHMITGLKCELPSLRILLGLFIFYNNFGIGEKCPDHN